jgi:hypothetical protein
MKEQYINNFKQEIEFSLIHSQEINKLLLERLINLNDSLGDISKFDYDNYSFKLTLNTIVNVDNNFILVDFIDFIKFNSELLIKDKDKSIYLSIYIWSKESTDTPQIDFADDVLYLLGRIGVQLSFVVYTY